jgi:hypothetical protein
MASDGGALAGPRPNAVTRRRGAKRGALEPIVYRTTPPGRAASLWRAARIAVFGYDVFLSHAHKDARDYATALWPLLEEAGLTICFDREDFHVGDRLHFTMRRTVRSSRAILLLDTPAARNSKEVRREVAEADEAKRPILVVRLATLGESPWPAVDGADALIHHSEVPSRFRYGRPSAAAVSAIDAGCRARRVRTQFNRLVATIALTIAVLAGWGLVNRAFVARLAHVYALAHNPDVSIVTLDAAVSALEHHPVWGRFGRLFHQASLDLLADETSRIQLKRSRWALASAVERARVPPDAFDIHTAPKQTHAIAPTSSAILGPGGNGLVLSSALRRDPCTMPATETTPTAVAAGPGHHRLAFTTAIGIFTWENGGCQATPHAVESSGQTAVASRPVRLQFGDQGRALLVAYPDRLLVLHCPANAPCQPTSIRTPDDVAPDMPGAQFCDAMISPDSELVVARIGKCDEPSADVCALAEPMRCARGVDHSILGIDPAGERLLLVRGGAVQVRSLTGMAPTRLQKPPIDPNEWGTTSDRLNVDDIDALAFSPDGSRVLVGAQVNDKPILAVYEWPGLRLIHVEALSGIPTMLVAHERVLVRTGSTIEAFDLRLKARPAASAAERRSHRRAADSQDTSPSQPRR